MTATLTSTIAEGLKLGDSFEATLPEDEHTPHTVCVIDKTSPGTWTGDQLRDTVWSTRYAALYFFNRCPWVEAAYVGPVADVVLLSASPVAGIPTVSGIPAGAWICELADTSDQPGAIGYHEGQSRTTKEGASGAHAERGIALHPATGQETVLMRNFVKTAREDNVYVTEVITHELFEARVDPYVNNEAEIRAYPNPADGKEYIGEVGDPVQERAVDVGAPEGRPCERPEALITDWAYPKWWGQPQSRAATCFTEDETLWKRLPALPSIAPFQIAAGGYMSVRTPGQEWEQINGEKHIGGGANPL